MCCGRSCGSTVFSTLAGFIQFGLGLSLLVLSSHKLQPDHGECVFGQHGAGPYVCTAIIDIALASVLVAVTITVAQGLSLLLFGGGQILVEILGRLIMAISCLCVAITATVFASRADDDYMSGGKYRHSAVALSWALFGVSLALLINSLSDASWCGLCCLLCCCASEASVAGDDRCLLALEALGLMWCLKGLLERRRPAYNASGCDPLLLHHVAYYQQDHYVQQDPHIYQAPHPHYYPPPLQSCHSIQPVIGSFRWPNQYSVPPPISSGPPVQPPMMQHPPSYHVGHHDGGPVLPYPPDIGLAQPYHPEAAYPHVPGGACYPSSNAYPSLQPSAPPEDCHEPPATGYPCKK